MKTTETHVFTERENGFGPVSVTVTRDGTVYIEGWKAEEDTLFYIEVDLRTARIATQKEWHGKEWRSKNAV